MKRSVRDRFRRATDKTQPKPSYISNEKNSSKNRILKHYFPGYDLHPLNPDYISPKSSKTEVKKLESTKETLAYQRNKTRNLPNYRISKENFSVKKQYEDSPYSGPGIQMPKPSKSYKLKRTERYINEPESGENTHSSGSRKSTRTREKRERHSSNSHRSYQSTTSSRSNPEEEEYENTGRNRERYEAQLQREATELSRKSHIPFSSNRSPDSDGRKSDYVDQDGRNAPRDSFLPPPGFPPPATTAYPGYPVVPSAYPFPGATAPYAAAPAQPYPFPPGYPPTNGFIYPPAPFPGGANPAVGQLNQSPTNLSYYNYSNPADSRRLNLPIVPPVNAPYNPFVYNVEVDNQLRNKTQTDSNLTRRDIVGVSTNQKPIYSGNEANSSRNTENSNNPSTLQSDHTQQPAQKPFPYDLQHYRYSTEKNQNQSQSERKQYTERNGLDSIPYEKNYDRHDRTQHEQKTKQDYGPDYGQGIESAFTYSGHSPRGSKFSHIKELEGNMKSKYGGESFESYDLNSHADGKRGDKIPYADQGNYNQPVGYNQNHPGNVETSHGGNVPCQQYNPSPNRYYHPPLKSSRYLNVDDNFKDPRNSRR